MRAAAQREIRSNANGAGEKLSSVERAYQRLKSQIMNNELPAGATYFEPELAGMLGVNRMIAHEAAALLAREGLVEVRPRRGVRVLPISLEDLGEIYDILTELESLAAERAAERGLTADERDQMASALRDMDQALAEQDLFAWAEADSRFHKLLAQFSGSRRLLAAISMHWDQAHRARILTLHLRPTPTGSAEDHHRLLEALDARDPERARRIHRAHRRWARTLLTSTLRKHRLHQL